MTTEIKYGEWKTIEGDASIPSSAQRRFLGDNWYAYREIDKQTSKGKCWLYHYRHLSPTMCENDLGSDSHYGTWTAEHVDGVPVRVVWEISQ